ncbi:N-acetyltransferase [Roseobacter sp.]|uniref:GNAT family N-acetyltransferase n=1 Tax=Roseobacter sp. TaxID=1907202 RepID=UPI00329715F2
MYRLTAENPQDSHEVEALFDLCFAPGREALSSYRLRDGIAPVGGLSLVARDADGILSGAIRFWPVMVGVHVALLLGPIAVHPTRQGEGLAGELIRASLARASGDGWARVMLVGDAPYYQRFGFAVLRDVVMPPPTNPDRVLGQALQPAAWDGVAGQVMPWQGALLQGS